MAGLSLDELALRIKALEEAYYAGERRITYGSGDAQVTVEYRTGEEMAQALERARARHDELSGAGQGLAVSIAQWRRRT